MNNNSELIIYTTEDGLTKIDVTFEEETVWLSLLVTVFGHSVVYSLESGQAIF